MKIPLSTNVLIDLDAPTLPAFETQIDEVTKWVVWCDHCETRHQHGALEGYREAHCKYLDSPYYKIDYNLRFCGKWVEQQ